MQRLAIIAGALVLLPACNAGTKPQPYTSEAGNFRVDFAGKPKQSRQTLPSPVGPLEMYSVETIDRKKTNRGVVYSDYPMHIVEASDPDAMLDGGVKGLIATGKWTLQSQDSVTLDGHPGREVRFEVNPPVASEKGLGRARIYLVGNRLYQAIVIGPASRVTEEELDQFVRSFELLHKVAPIERDAAISNVTIKRRRGGPIAQAHPGARRNQEPEQPSSSPLVNQPPPQAPARPRQPGGPDSMAVQTGDVGPDPAKPAEVPIALSADSHFLITRPDPGGNEQERFRDLAPERGLLVGIRVGYVDAFGGSKVGAVQPIYQVGDRYVDGKPHGKEIPMSVRLVARPGYAVSGFNTRAGLLLDAFQLVFMKYSDGKLDPADTYTSDWLGDPRGGGPGTSSSDGKLVVGIHGRTTGREVNALGLVIAE